MEIAAREALRIGTARQEWQEVAAAENILASLAQGSLPRIPAVAAGTDADLRDAVAAAELLLRQLVLTPAVRASAAPVARALGSRLMPRGLHLGKDTGIQP